MRIGHRSLTVWLGLVLWALQPALIAQSDGSLSGNVSLKDTGQPLHYASVSIEELDRSTVTDDDGNYEFDGVPPGTYRLIIHLDSLFTEVITMVIVEAGEAAQANIFLELLPRRYEVTVTASEEHETVFEAFQSVESLGPYEMAESADITIGELLDHRVGSGIAKRGFGPGPARPIIRGFDGDRVLIMEDGIRSGTLSSQSGDHGELINPALIERLEVVKGPATLLYSGSAMGGTVNAISRHHQVHHHPHKGVRGFISGSAGTSNSLGGVNAGFEMGAGNWLFWGQGGGLRTGDYTAPEQGAIYNSRSRIANGGGGFGFYGEKMFFSVEAKYDEGLYGVPFVQDFHGHHGHGEEDEHDHDEEEDEHDHDHDEEEEEGEDDDHDHDHDEEEEEGEDDDHDHDEEEEEGEDDDHDHDEEEEEGEDDDHDHDHDEEGEEGEDDDHDHDHDEEEEEGEDDDHDHDHDEEEEEGEDDDHDHDHDEEEEEGEDDDHDHDHDEEEEEADDDHDHDHDNGEDEEEADDDHDHDHDHDEEEEEADDDHDHDHDEEEEEADDDHDHDHDNGEDEEEGDDDHDHDHDNDNGEDEEEGEGEEDEDHDHDHDEEEGEGDEDEDHDHDEEEGEGDEDEDHDHDEEEGEEDEDHDHDEDEDHDEEDDHGHGGREIDRIVIDAHRLSYRFNWGLKDLGGAIDRFTLKLAYTDWSHDEIEYFTDGDWAIGTEFDNTQFTYRGVFEQQESGPLSGSFGFWGLNRDYSATGEEALSPPTTQNGFAVFALQVLDFENYKLQFGGRVETQRYNPSFAARGDGGHGHGGDAHGHGEDDHEEGLPDAVERTFTGASASVGIHADTWRNGAFVANYSHSYRAPSLEDLYNYGPHAGSLAFEIGDPTMDAETGDGIELSLRHEDDQVHGGLSFFYYGFRNFIFPFAPGERLDDLQVIEFTQRDARYAGAEAEFGFRLHRALWLDLGMDMVDAQDTNTGTPLPRIPPLRGKIGLDLNVGGWRINPELIVASEQNQTFTDETRTPGYSVVNLKASYTVAQQHVAHQFAVKVFNIGDRFYRNHSSFIKDLAPEIGRGVRLTYILRFF